MGSAACRMPHGAWQRQKTLFIPNARCLIKHIESSSKGGGDSNFGKGGVTQTGVGCVGYTRKYNINMITTKAQFKYICI